jgi:undecaprenyl phosphate-alpha-L-ara4FN deformylase
MTRSPALTGAWEARPRLLGLRVDVDTHDGMRDGVARLLDVLAAAGAGASFFFAMGPDRSGRALVNALRPRFVAKMLRTRAARLYGWRTLLSGTLLPSRPVASAFPALVRRVDRLGHETGVHAWDHRAWQDRIARFPAERVRSELDRGRESFIAIMGRSPACFAAPAWVTNDVALLHQERFGLLYASDCRGTEPFLPRIDGRSLRTPQIPATLPTLDEALGAECRDAPSFFTMIRERLRGGEWPVLTLHAELEGGPYAGDLAAFLDRLKDDGVRCLPLRELLGDRLRRGDLPVRSIGMRAIPGRHGVLSVAECGL